MVEIAYSTKNINEFDNTYSPVMIIKTQEQLEQGQEKQCGSYQQNEFTNPTIPWHKYDQFAFSPSSSYSNFSEEDDVIRFGCMSPYSGDESLVGLFGNEYPTSYEGYDWSN